MRGRIFKYIFFFSIFILLAFPVYADEAGDWCTEKKFSNCLNSGPPNSNKEMFEQEINRALNIQVYIKCIELQNLSDYAFWSNQKNFNNCNLSQNIAGWMTENCNCDSNLAAYSETDPYSTDSDYVLFNNALGREIFSLLQKGDISINGTPVPTPNSSAQTPIPINTPTPTSTVSLEISGGASFHTSKCGLAAAGFQCCYPNLKEGAISLKGSFFDLFQGIWNTVQSFILSNIDSYIGIGTQSMKDATFQGGSNINLCPRSEEGHKKQRFVDLENSVWLDKIEDFDGNPDSKGQVQMSDNKELKDYSIFINGNSASGSPAGEDGLISAFFNQETLPTDGVEYKDKKYACFCVDPEKQRDETPESFLSLAENASLKNAANSFRTSSNQVSDLNNRVLLENDEGVGAREGAAKMCRNITDVDERVDCQKCVSSGDKDLGGAWTAVGCIKADFSTTLQERLFPLFISFGGLISLGCIIYASFLLQTSMGEPEKITKAQELMTSCIAGLIMIIFSVFILRVIGVDILRLPGLDQEVLTPTPTVSPTTQSNPSSSTPSTTNSYTSPTPALPITTPLSATSSPVITPTPTPTPISFINNAIIYQENGTIFTLTPMPDSTIVGIYENTNKNYTLFQLNIEDQPNKNFYTKKENLPISPTITGLPTLIHPFKCNTDIGSNEIQIYDDNIITSFSGGACAKLTLEKGESIFDLSKLKHDEMNEEWWRPRCDDNFEDCIASFKLGSGVKVELHRSRDCNDPTPLNHSAEGNIIISDIDTNWFPASYTDSISCIKLKPHS